MPALLVLSLPFALVLWRTVIKKNLQASLASAPCSSELGSAVGYTWPVTGHIVCQQQAINHSLYLQHSSLIAPQSSYLLSLLALTPVFMILNSQAFILKVLSIMCLRSTEIPSISPWLKRCSSRMLTQQQIRVFVTVMEVISYSSSLTTG